MTFATVRASPKGSELILSHPRLRPRQRSRLAGVAEAFLHGGFHGIDGGNRFLLAGDAQRGIRFHRNEPATGLERLVVDALVQATEGGRAAVVRVRKVGDDRVAVRSDPAEGVQGADQAGHASGQGFQEFALDRAGLLPLVSFPVPDADEHVADRATA